MLAITHSECQMCFSGFWSHAIPRMPAKQYTHFSSCHPHGVRKGLIKGEALGLKRTNSSAKSFYEYIYNFKKHLRARGYPHNLIEKITSEIKFTERKSALQNNNENSAFRYHVPPCFVALISGLPKGLWERRFRWRRGEAHLKTPLP